ncbi:MAG: ABC transporter ATP-binding protein [Nitrospirae bacterium]|nr:ABC transporter ATP-binding protein [Nitrospirota bacterium]
MIEVSDLAKRFGNFDAVRGVSFTVREGESLGLLGPNGAGKTTIMRMITGSLPPTGGAVKIDGLDMYDHPAAIKKIIGYLPERPPLYPDMTVREYLGFAASIRGVASDAIDEAIRRTASICGVTDRLNKLIRSLSKGYQQRVGLAQALVHEPRVLILDEPTSGLDPRQIIEIRDLIRDLGESRTVIFSSHILSEVTAVCSKVAIIGNGRLLLEESMSGVSGRVGEGRRIHLSVARPHMVDEARLMALDGVISLKGASTGNWIIGTRAGIDVREAVAGAVFEMGAGLVEMKSETISLEDVFMRVVAGGQA